MPYACDAADHSIPRGTAVLPSMADCAAAGPLIEKEIKFRSKRALLVRSSAMFHALVLMVGSQHGLDDAMTFQMRREDREEVGRQAWLDAGDGGPTLACTLVDISKSGAKLVIDEVGQIPESFTLRLSRFGRPYSCRVVWRRHDAIGVKFAPR
jgi:hypothetical protein